MATVRVSSVFGALLTLALTPGISRAQWQVGTAPSFSSGKYGTDTRTDVLYMPITARRLFGNGDLTLVFPFTCIRGDGDVTVVNGTPTPQTPTRDATTPTRGGTTTTTTPGRGTSAPGTVAPGTVAPGTTSGTVAPGTLAPVMECGVGDLVVRGRLYLVDEHGWAPTIALRAHIKTPTASADRGLGTGRPDEGIGIEVSRTIGRGVFALADAGYTIIGKPAGVDFQNSWWYDVGLGKSLARNTVSVSVFFEEYSAIVPGLVNARDVLAALNITAAGGWRLQISGELGLSDGAPDHGFTFGASRRF